MAKELDAVAATEQVATESGKVATEQVAASEQTAAKQAAEREKDQIIDAHVINVAACYDRNQVVISDRLAITLDKTFNTIDMNTGSVIATNRIYVNPFQLQVVAATKKVIVKLLAKCSAKVQAFEQLKKMPNALSEEEKKTSKRYGINPNVWLVALLGAEVKFSKTFRLATELRYNGDAFGNDLYQTELIALNAPMLDGELSAIKDALNDMFDDDDDDDLISATAKKLIIELAPKTSAAPKDAVAAVFG